MRTLQSKAKPPQRASTAWRGAEVAGAHQHAGERDVVRSGPTSLVRRDFTQVPTHSPLTSPLAARGRAIAVPLDGVTHPLAASLNAPGARFRLPEFDKVKAAYTDKTLKIPEAVIKDRVTRLLGRMEADGRLKSTDSVPTIVAKIFPSPGVIDQIEFEKAVDVADRRKIYQSVTDADTKVLAADKPKLQTAMKDAAADIKTVEGDAAGLTQVFGAKDATAKANYVKARKVLEDLAASAAKVDAEVTTDYNLDDPEVGLGGWAIGKDKRMHLTLRVAQVTDPAESKATLIHEASHFANGSVDDHVYYGRAGFFQADEATKVTNAAHYEELPRRLSKTSKFDKQTFTPGLMPGGGAETREDKVLAATAQYMRQAWDAGVDTFTLVRGVRREFLAGNRKPFTDNKGLLLEISKLMDLTIHEQQAGKEVVTTLDVTIAESVSRGVAKVQKLVLKEPFPKAASKLTDVQIRDTIVRIGTVKYGNLLKDGARDKALLDWLNAHYKSLPRVWP